jgi:hypothetical protein
MRKSLRSLVSGLTVCAGLAGASVAEAAFTQVSPFGNIIGTGTSGSQYTNAPSGGGTGAWYDKNVLNTSYSLVGNPAIYYQEQWAAPQTFWNVYLDATMRGFNGQIFFDVDGDINHTYETAGPIYTGVPGYGTRRVTTDGVTAYGIKVVVDGTGVGANDYHQIGDVEINTTYIPQNQALLPNTTQISSASPQSNGSIHDDLYGHLGSEWRSNTAIDSNFIGMTFDDGPRRVQSLRIATSTPHGLTWAWEQFHVETLIAGTWVDQGIAQLPLSGGNATQDLVWINFGTSMWISGVRLIGFDSDNTNGNTNPTLRDVIVDEIAVFDQAPEPTSMGLLATGAVLLIRRRRA